MKIPKKFWQLNGTHSAKQYTVIAEPAHPPGWRMEPHSHIQHEITYVRRGACYFSLQDRLHRIEAGDVCFLPQHVLHGHEPYQGHSVELVVVQFPDLDTDLQKQLINSEPIGHYHLSELERSQFLSICYNLQREIAGRLSHADFLCHSYVNQLGVLMLRSAARQGIESLSADQQEVVEIALDWIHDNWHRTFQISDLAERVGFSASHFRALFRQAVGVSPKQYVMTLRLQSSKCMLMHAESTVTEVARLAGFNSPQQFSRVFRRLTGIPPSEWKKIHLD
jgi:AraC-like DNA-binding protein/quercetin dioxygenase-like cupin family protein